MKQRLRNILAKISSFTEIYINALIIIGIIIFSFIIIKDLYNSISMLLHNNMDFQIELFLGHALQLIIGVEFVKMVAKHTTDSALDVLMFTIARKMIIEHGNSMLDLLIGSISIAVLVLLKRYFLNSSANIDDNSIIFNGGTPIQKVNTQMGAHIPDCIGNTIAGVLVNHLNYIKQKATVGYRLSFEDVDIEVYSMDEELIKQVRVIPKTKKKSFFKK